MRHDRAIRVCALLGVVGCVSTPSRTDDPARERMLALLVPSRIEIVAPFTHVRRLSDETMPEGIELLVQAANSLDDPGMIVGSIHVDLFEYVPASGDSKGRHLDYWDIELTTVSQQRTYWNQATQMYEFRLQVDPNVIPRKDRFVLQVTYTSPLGDHLTDHCVIDSRSARRTPRSRARRPETAGISAGG